MDINKRNRTELKSYFVKNSIPTEGNFVDLIDGMLNQKDDGLVKLPGDPLSLVATGDQTSLKKVINFYDDFVQTDPSWTLSLRSKPDANKPGWNLSDGKGNSRLFIDRDSGYVGVGTVSPQNELHVGSGSSSIPSSQVNAVVASQRESAGIAIAQKDGINVLLRADRNGGYLGTTSDNQLTLGANREVSVAVSGDKVYVRTPLLLRGGVTIGWPKGVGDRIISFQTHADERDDGGRIEYTPAALMIAGAGVVDPKTKEPLPRKISLYDDVDVNGELIVNGDLFSKCRYFEGQPAVPPSIQGGGQERDYRMFVKNSLKDKPVGTMVQALQYPPELVTKVPIRDPQVWLWIGFKPNPKNAWIGRIRITEPMALSDFT